MWVARRLLVELVLPRFVGGFRGPPTGKPPVWESPPEKKDGRASKLNKWGTLPPMNVKPDTEFLKDHCPFKGTPVRFHVEWWEGSGYAHFI